MRAIKVPIRGMHCASCEVLVGENVRKVAGVDVVKVNQRRAEAIIEYRGVQPAAEAIRQAIQDAGYEVGFKDKLPWISKNPRDYKD